MNALRGRLVLVAAAALVLLLVASRSLAVFYTDALWYEAVGFVDVFWKRVFVSVGVIAIATLLASVVVGLNLWQVTRALGPVRVRRRYGNLEIAEQIPRRLVQIGVAFAAVLAGWWIANMQFGGGAAVDVLMWSSRVDWGLTDPLFGRDVSFYVFTLPVLFRFLDFLTLTVVWSFALSILGYVLIGAVRWVEGKPEVDPAPRTHALILAAALLVLIGVRYWVAQYAVAINGNGFSGAVGYTDVHARLPGYRIMALLSLLAAGAVVFAARRGRLLPAAAAGVLMVAGAVVLGQLYPSLVQRFRVEPNQLVREHTYIGWNLDFTRRAYGVDDLQRLPYAYREGASSAAAVMPRVSTLPLWDTRQLETVFDQVQALAGYYDFPNFDYDRYGPPGDVRQVGLGVREFRAEGLPPEKRTWQTLKLNPQFIRGLGAVAAPAAEASALGQPVPWLYNIDPVQTTANAPPGIALTQPVIYFGESMADYVIVTDPASEAERPLGVEITSVLKTLSLALRFADKNMLLSGQVGEGSVVLFRRLVRDRVRAVAPFIRWPDAAGSTYPVIADGRVMWVIEGFTATAAFPFSRATRGEDLGVLRYVRNSVKAVVDGTTGAITIYAMDSEDPLLKTYARAFPGLVRPLAEMPPTIREHLRYPPILLQLQADVLEEYHLPTVESFYAGQDVWQLPRSIGGGAEEEVYAPQFLLTSLPDSTRVEFLLQIPFIARNRQNMTGLLMARNDGANYGELRLYELPRDVQIPGPGQVESIMEQDPAISQQLSLWRQSGSDVQLGQLRVVPVDSAFLYIEPLFLLARGRPIPELERVLVSDGRAVAMGPNLVAALQTLLGGSGAPGEADQPAAPGAPPRAAATAGWPADALRLLDQADQHLRRGEWAEFGARLAELRAILREAGASAPGQ